MRAKVLTGACVFVLLFAPGAFAATMFTFHGNIDLAKEQFELILDVPSSTDGVPAPAGADGAENNPSFLALSAARTARNNYHLSLDVDHVTTPLGHLLSDIETVVEVFDDDANPLLLRGEIRSSDSLLDYKPIRELAGHFEIKDNRLLLRSLSVGNLSCRGSLELVYPFKVDLNVFLHNVAMEDFLNFWVRNKQYKSFGTVSGEIDVSGTWDRLGLKGNLESHDGYVEQLEYNSIQLNAEGIYPRLSINPSLISRAGGLSFTFSGPFDLSDRKNFKKQIGMLVLAPLVSDSASGKEWTIKRWDRRKSRFTEIKYLLRKEDKIEEESGMLGVEQTVAF